MGITLLIILFTTTAIAAPVFLGGRHNLTSKSPNKLVGLDCKIIKTCDADMGATFGARSEAPKVVGRSGFDDCGALENCDANSDGGSDASESNEGCNEQTSEDPYQYVLDVRLGGNKESAETQPKKKKCNTKATTTQRPRTTRRPVTAATDDSGWGSGSATEAIAGLETTANPQGITYTSTIPTPATEYQDSAGQNGEPTTTKMGITNDMYASTSGENVMRPTTNSGLVEHTTEAEYRPSTAIQEYHTIKTTVPVEHISEATYRPSTVIQEHLKTTVPVEHTSEATYRPSTVIQEHLKTTVPIEHTSEATYRPSTVIQEHLKTTVPIEHTSEATYRPSTVIQEHLKTTVPIEHTSEATYRPSPVIQEHLKTTVPVEHTSEATYRPSTVQEHYTTKTTAPAMQETSEVDQQTSIPVTLPQNNFGYVPGFGNCFVTGTCNQGFNIPGFANNGCKGGRCGGGQTNFGGFNQLFSNFGNRGRNGGSPFGNFFDVAGK